MIIFTRQKWSYRFRKQTYGSQVIDIDSVPYIRWITGKGGTGSKEPICQFR